MTINVLDQYRVRLLQRNLSIPSFQKPWNEKWKSAVSKILLDDKLYPEQRIFQLGNRLREIFQSTADDPNRGQATLSGGGAGWEALVVWYLNLGMWSTNAVITKPYEQFTPQIIKSAMSVQINNNITNTESDLIGFTVPRLPTSVTDVDAQIQKLTNEFQAEMDVRVFQCKTNWNDNAQIPMLWDLIYNARGFRANHILVGVNGADISNFSSFRYSFVTVPSQKNPDGFKPTSLAVQRVNNMSGRNYWGLPTKSGVSSSIAEAFSSEFKNSFTKGLLPHMRGLHKDNSVFELIIASASN